jgi:dCMP deaminase|tara:strand:+ start:2812 stop:3276 length:465 start_codon:yes stop_codon:yes gene_type:complete
MFSALWTATRSSCLHLQTGAVIVKDKRIIASGYNGAPPGIKSSLELNSCRKDEHGVDFKDKGKSVCRGLHAEMNAIDQIAREDLKETSIYSLYFPCSSCAKEIVGNGITEVIYSRIYAEPDSLTKELFEEGGIQLRKLELDTTKYFDIIKNIIK